MKGQGCGEAEVSGRVSGQMAMEPHVCVNLSRLALLAYELCQMYIEELCSSTPSPGPLEPEVTPFPPQKKPLPLGPLKLEIDPHPTLDQPLCPYLAT